MNVITMSGTVADTSTLPKWDDVFKSLIEPSKIILQDTFSAGAGAMGGRTLEKYDTVKTWTPLGTSGAYWQVNAGGYASISTAATSRITVTHKTAGKLYAAVEYGGSGFVGLLFRFADQNNLWQVSLATTGSKMRIEKIVAGTNTLVATPAVTLTAGRIYHIGITYTTSGFTVAVDNVTVANITDSDLSSNTGVGVVSSVTTNKIWEFAAG